MISSTLEFIQSRGPNDYWRGFSIASFLHKTKCYLSGRPFDELPLHGIGCEVGVNAGAHACRMLRLHPKIELLYLCDPYLEYHQERDLAGARRKAHGRLANHPKTMFLERKCEDAGPALPMLDFCYIDGDHSYAGVYSDIRTIWPKMKSGGIMGGHDFHHTWPGVIKAVTEFTALNAIALHVETPDWWVIKP